MTNSNLINKENTVTLNSKNTKKKQSKAFVYASPKQERIAQRIERVACKLYACKYMSEFQEEILLNRLAVLLLNFMGLKDFTPYRYADGTPLESKNSAKRYSSIVFTRCLNDTLKIYGKVDRKTNTRIPFLQLFNHNRTKRRSDVITEHALDEAHTNTKAKREVQRALFKEAKAEVGYTGKVPRIDYSNLKALLSNLRLIGAPEYYMVQAEENHKAYYEQKDSVREEYKESDRHANDSYAIVKQTERENAMFQIVDLIERVKKQAVAEKNRKVIKHFRDFLTLKAHEYVNSGDGEYVILLIEHLNKGLLDDVDTLYETLAFEDDDSKVSDIDIYSAITGKQHDTIRKSFKTVQKFVIACANNAELAA